MSPISARSNRSAVITGSGTGLGREIALGLAARGYIVFGTATSASEVENLKEASGGRVSLAVCNVTRLESVNAWAGGVSDALDGAGLDILISNAEVLAPGPVEVLPLDAVRQQFEVNVFGALSVINAFLPALRKAHGRIVEISSWTASLPLPFHGSVAASKAAIEAFCAAYRAELKPFGIDVVVVPTGMVGTGSREDTALSVERIAGRMTPDQRKLYGKAFYTAAGMLADLQAADMPPAAVAARVIEIAEQRPAQSRAVVGSLAEDMLRAVREKSDAELDVLRLKLVGLN